WYSWCGICHTARIVTSNRLVTRFSAHSYRTLVTHARHAVSRRQSRPTVPVGPSERTELERRRTPTRPASPVCRAPRRIGGAGARLAGWRRAGRGPPPRTPARRGVLAAGVWNDLGPLRALEAEIGREFDIAHWYTSWDHAYDPVPVDDVLAHGRIPLVSWQPHHQTVQDIAAGHHDDYVRAWARAAATANGTIYLRPSPEMNGNWTPWNGDPTTLRTAWRHIHHLFQQEGATNVRWVFSPNVTDEPRTTTNQLENYYPGHDVVDILALDGYNWGDTRPHIGWRDFDTIFHTAYDRITQLGEQPIWITEIASSDVGGDKSAWVE